MRVTRQSDNLWARLLDVPSAFTQRAYGSEGEVTFRIVEDGMCPTNVGTWHLLSDGATGECERTDQPAHVTLTIQALSSLYLGGMSAQDFASAGHLTPHLDGAVERLARLFRVDPEPHNSFGF
jgi:predicted acetyltransferase